MSPADLLGLLIELTAASSAGMVLVLIARMPLRRRFGPALAYATWLLPLVAMMAVLLPAPVAPPMLAQGVVRLAVQPSAVAPADATVGFSTWLCVLWMAGVLGFAAWMADRQRRFVRQLGALRRRCDGCHQATTAAGLPATLGLWRPRIILPADFERRYSEQQRAVMLAHERAHIASGDLIVNAVAAALRCLFWFNPLLHVAVRRLRHDQELVCDQRVLARHPLARRTYGEAMLTAQLGVQSPLGCHWGYGHPLKERIEMLKQPVPSRSRWLGGSVLVGALTLVFAYGAWAAQPAQTGKAADAAPADRMVSAASRMPPPRYPQEAAQQGIDGSVVLVVEVDAQGRATDVQVERAEPAGVFEQAAIEAARQWVYEPAIENGKPVPSRLRVPILFESDGRAGLSSRVVNRLPPPAYPKTAVEERISGRVVLVVAIDKNGNPIDVEVERSEPAGVFDAAAIEAAMQWTFTPAVEDGRRVPSRVRVPVDFEIPPGESAGGAAGADVLALKGSAVREVSCDRVVGKSDGSQVLCIN